jgi:hypothetical protein
MDESPAALELEKALQARNIGNEGMARVLARRAAALAIRSYLAKQDFDQRGLSLNALIKDEEVRKGLPSSTYGALNRLTTRTGMDFQFPIDFDLLLDAQLVIEILSTNLGEKND